MILDFLKYALVAAALFAGASAASGAVNRPKVEKPDLDKIKMESTDPTSKYYYPRLLKMFMSNDTVMTDDDYRYFYYGTLFQEDFDPYREPVDAERLNSIEPLYYKTEHTNAEKDMMMQYAQAELANNPIDLVQLKNLIYVYEKKQKVNLAKIWKHKLNHLLLTIASSGTGADTDNAWIVVYPRHEYDFLNLSGLTAQAQEFVPPYYEHITVQPKSEKDPTGYYFDIHSLLEQYYLKHPGEMQN